MKKIFLLVHYIFLSLSLIAQEKENPSDSAKWLQYVVVSAFELQGSLLKVPAAVNVINKSSLLQWGPANIVQAINTQAGVKMEERSPGSYRINIRASSLRAPFGVRNVKVYYHGIPYTTPGGDSYFNQFGFYNFQTLEIIKGPGSSMYGAGTGGVILINPNAAAKKDAWALDVQGGAYGMKSYHVKLSVGSDTFHQELQYQRFQSAGFRDHTSMHRDVLNWNTAMKIGKRGTLQTFFFYGDLSYQTPGGLSRVEFDAAPRMSRPKVGSLPSAIQAQAAVQQKTWLSGMVYQTILNNSWTQETTLYGAYTQLRNPGIFSYSATNEPHVGGRAVFHFKKESFKFDWGAEAQQGFSTYRSFKNVNGLPDSVKTDDEVKNSQQFVFAQGSYELPHRWNMAAGVSVNRLRVAVNRLQVLPVKPYQKKYDAVVIPRLSILKYWPQGYSIYASYSGGFSSPTLSELLPSSGILATTLEAERGRNIELGARGDFLQKRLHVDLNMFDFHLQQAIVVRRDPQGRDYFINAGAIAQRGIESSFQFDLIKYPKGIWKDVRWDIQHTFYHFKYKDFKKGNIDFSGKQLPGVPHQQWQTGMDVRFLNHLYFHIQYQQVAVTPLNDANTDRAPAYALLDMKMGFQHIIRKHWNVDYYILGNNLSNQSYSLGYDLNATGGRYWNTASGRNWGVGMRILR